MKDELERADHPSSFRIHPFYLIGVLFLALRLPLLLVRAPFFDELFTRWVAAKSFAEILAALRYDSGPPLYYFVVHMLGDPAVAVTRVVSLLCAAISLSMILRSNRGTAITPAIETPTILAAALLAIFPPAVLFAGDARAYAMCAMFVTGAMLAIDDGRPMVAAITLVLAAYSHYYGVLFFPLLLLGPAGMTRSVLDGWKRRCAALAIAVALFIPGLLLALHQPEGARAWMNAEWPSALFVRPPLALAIVGGVAFFLSLRVNRYLLMVLVPLVLAIVMRVYIPIRFEAVIAAPLAMWLGESLRQNRFRLFLMAVLIAIGASWSVLGFIDHLHRPPDSYRQAALWTAKNIAASDSVVASGYCYLETLMNGHPRVTTFPLEQALHPGWRALPAPGLPAPHGTFFWIGERQAPELAILVRERRQIEPLFINDRAMVALVR